MEETHVVIDGKHYHRHNLHTLPGELNTFDVTSDSNSDTLGFFGELHPFSNFHPHQFNCEGEEFNSSEQYIQWKKATFFKDYPTMIRILNCEDAMDSKETARDINNFDRKSWNEVAEELITSTDNHVPEKTLKLGRKSLIRDPWITTGILRSLRWQKQLYKEILLSNNDVSTFRYRSYHNCLHKIIRSNRQHYLHDKCKEYRQNGRKLWQLINRLIGRENNKHNTIESLKVDNLIKYDSESITKSFNDFFSTVGESLAEQQICNPPNLKTT